MRRLLLYLIVLWEPLTIVASEIPTVRLGDTIVIGSRMKTVNGRNIDAFENIPYAEPPIGNLRFKPTVPLTKLPKIINASSQEPILCLQFDLVTFSKDIIGSEDCLILNVYVPKERQVLKPLPVAVFVFGGSYMHFAASSLFNGPKKLLDHDLILVTVNYRLGVLGFLSTGDDASPGNYAVWDVLTSLHWVRDNIKEFGGNPNDVTLFGQSSGAMSISLLMISPLAAGLFHKAILDSGSILLRGFINLNPIREAQLLADSFWCPVTPTQALVDCLRKQSAKKLIFQGYIVPLGKATILFPRFVPVVDKHLLLDHPYEMYSKGLFHRIPILTGVNLQEAGFIYFLTYKVESRYYENEENIWERNKNKFVDVITRTREEKKFLLQQVEEIYFTGVNKSDRVAVRKCIINFISDIFFKLPAAELVKYVSQFTSTYLYKFQYKGAFTIVDGLSLYDKRFFDNTNVVHSDELKYLFSNFFDFIKMPKQDLDFQKDFLKLWSNFIIYGNPTPHGDPVKWEPVKTSELEFLSIGKEMSMQTGFQNDQVRHLNEVVIPCLNKLEQDLFTMIGSIDHLNTNCKFKLIKDKTFSID